MDSRKHSILSLLFVMLMGIPIYFIIALGEKSSAGDWEGLEIGLTHYLISIWSTWILTASIAIYYKWTEKKNFFFYMTYSYLVIAFALFVHYNAQWLQQANLSSQPYGENMLNLIATAKHLVPILLSTGYLQASVWWFERKWHRP